MKLLSLALALVISGVFTQPANADQKSARFFGLMGELITHPKAKDFVSDSTNAELIQEGQEFCRSLGDGFTLLDHSNAVQKAVLRNPEIAQAVKAGFVEYKAALHLASIYSYCPEQEWQFDFATAKDREEQCHVLFAVEGPVPGVADGWVRYDCDDFYGRRR